MACLQKNYFTHCLWMDNVDEDDLMRHDLAASLSVNTKHLRCSRRSFEAKIAAFTASTFRPLITLFVSLWSFLSCSRAVGLQRKYFHRRPCLYKQRPSLTHCPRPPEMHPSRCSAAACVEDVTALSCIKRNSIRGSPILMSKALRVVGVLTRSWANMSFLWTSQDNILPQNMR